MRCWGIGATPLSWLKSSTTCYATFPPCRPISVTTRFSYKNYRKRLVRTKCFMSNPSKFYGQFQVNPKYITYRSDRAHFSGFQSVLKERDVGRILKCSYCKRFDQSDDSYYVKLWLTNRFQVAVRLFSNRSQMKSKCDRNKKVAHEAQPSVSLIFLPHFDVLYDLLLNRRTATWNLFVLCSKELKKVLMMTSSIRLSSNRS